MRRDPDAALTRFCDSAGTGLFSPGQLTQPEFVADRAMSRTGVKLGAISVERVGSHVERYFLRVGDDQRLDLAAREAGSEILKRSLLPIVDGPGSVRSSMLPGLAGIWARPAARALI